MLIATGVFACLFFFSPATMNRSYLLHSSGHGPTTFPASIPYGEGRMFRNRDAEDKGSSKYCTSSLQKWSNDFSGIFHQRKPKRNVVPLCSVVGQQKITFASDRSLSQVQDLSRQGFISHVLVLQYEANKFLKNLCHSQLTYILLTDNTDCLIFALRVKHHFRVAWQLCFPSLSKRDGFI